MTPARQLSDRLASLYRNERNAMADLLIALSDFDRRRTWRELGLPSLWVYPTRELNTSLPRWRAPSGSGPRGGVSASSPMAGGATPPGRSSSTTSSRSPSAARQRWRTSASPAGGATSSPHDGPSGTSWWTALPRGRIAHAGRSIRRGRPLGPRGVATRARRARPLHVTNAKRYRLRGELLAGRSRGHRSRASEPLRRAGTAPCRPSQGPRAPPGSGHAACRPPPPP
jgi:hypothetical protein